MKTSLNDNIIVIVLESASDIEDMWHRMNENIDTLTKGKAILPVDDFNTFKLWLRLDEYRNKYVKPGATFPE